MSKTNPYRSIVRCLILALFFFSLVPVGEIRAGSPEECSNYSASTMMQIKEAKDLGIPNIGPPRWVEDSHAHYNWCLSVPKEWANSEYSQRQQIIDNYKSSKTVKQPVGKAGTGIPGAGGQKMPAPPTVVQPTGTLIMPTDQLTGKLLPFAQKKAYCNSYAQEAVQQYQQAINYKIEGLVPPLWGNYQDQLDWCVKNIDTEWPEKFKRQRSNTINNFVKNRSWRHCADEGKRCTDWVFKVAPRADGTEEVLLSQARYGARIYGLASDNPGVYLYASPSHDFYCNDDFFDGDPLPYTDKYCEVDMDGYKSTAFTTGDWEIFASEGQSKNAKGLIRYGFEGNYLYKISIPSGGPFDEKIACNNTTFGGDPAPGRTKYCSKRPLLFRTTANDDKRDWIFCGDEGKKCRFVGIKRVRYGVPGKYVYYILDEYIYCNKNPKDDVLPWYEDPAPGLKKSCFYADL